MLSGSLNKQVQRMHYELGHTPEQIADSLHLAIEDVTFSIATVAPSRQTNSTKELLSKHVRRAAEVQGELLEDYENPHIQQKVSEFITKVALGVFDPPMKADEKGGGITIQQFNTVVLQSNKAYEDALKAAGISIKEPQALLDVETVKQ